MSKTEPQVERPDIDEPKRARPRADEAIDAAGADAVAPAVLAISVAAGLLAASAGVAPTGDMTVDAVLVGTAVTGATWLGAAALRWDAALITLIAGLTSWNPIGTVLGVFGAAGGYLVDVEPRHRRVVNAAMIALALNIGARSDLGLFLGASTVVVTALAMFVAIVGFRRRRRTDRHAVHVIGVAVVVAAVVAVVGAIAFAVAGASAARDLRVGVDAAEDALDHLGAGDTVAAAQALEAATDAFETADARFGSPLASPARFVPGLAQHQRVAAELTDGAAESAARLGVAVRQLDLDSLAVSGGRIDIDRVIAIQAPLLAVQQQIDSLRATLDEVASPWLLPPVQDRLDELAVELDRAGRRTFDAVGVAVAAPAMLGADGPRTYFVGFTTPSEARGIGGFMGNWAEVTIDDGQLSVTRFGRSDELNTGGDPDTRRFSRGVGLDEWLGRYGSYNLSSGPDGTTGSEPWKNINMSPDMAATGRAVADLYPQSGGGELDGVFMVDVATLARLLEFTGPIPVPNGDATSGAGAAVVTSETAVEYLLHGQYDLTATQQRIDALAGFSQSVLDALLATTLPPPTALLDRLGPMVDQGRFTGWASRAEEQRVFAQIGLAGTLPVASDDDAVAVVFNNAAGNKIDYYLGAEARYDVVADSATNSASASFELTLTNGAPAVGRPGYVIGNLIGLPPGHNRTWVSIFTQLPVTTVTLDGLPVDIERGSEAGYFVTSVFVTLAPGADATVRLELDGPIDATDGYTLAVRTPSAVSPTEMTIEATWVGPDAVARRADRSAAAPGVDTLTLDTGS